MPFQPTLLQRFGLWLAGEALFEREAAAYRRGIHEGIVPGELGAMSHIECPVDPLSHAIEPQPHDACAQGSQAPDALETLIERGEAQRVQLHSISNPKPPELDEADRVHAEFIRQDQENAGNPIRDILR